MTKHVRIEQTDVASGSEPRGQINTDSCTCRLETTHDGSSMADRSLVGLVAVLDAAIRMDSTAMGGDAHRATTLAPCWLSLAQQIRQKTDSEP